MITTRTNELFETRVQSFPVGLVGTVGVRILDNVGGTVLARRTTGIVEDVPGSYVTNLLAPAALGQYSVEWDWGADPSQQAFEDLYVTALGARSDTGTVVLAPTVTTPHFDLPFRLSGSRFAVVEQDDYADVANCVEAIVRTPYGYRDDTPDFGFPYDAFEVQPIGATQIGEIIEGQEPRARILTTETMDEVDNLVDHLRIEVQPR